jgi:transcription-repair coupling factor (superfamily II helicase)
MRDMAEELLKLYAARKAVAGHAFSPDSHWHQEFGDAFEYDLTIDQQNAIADIARDMESPTPMDRLLCGDVGYGKTEVAMRAAFKAVVDGKQVAFLAPTTILAFQHERTLRERFAAFPVKIDMVSRFRTKQEQKETLKALAGGQVDIIVGTHRLLSKDVVFRDLGLLVVDEEQRFGVGHKERIKQLRTHVDVLTMSATPIPRTLNFSLIGIRDMSLINTAPNDRLPIHTAIEAWDENVIKEAIERELARQGQVFFLHNRVQTIDQVSMMVRRLVPQARLAIGHGQMARHQLEDVMTAFVNREVDVLICTTIIATGIDIPNANTIIVDRAEMFGLAELYQIRGRVGRYKHRAFAYLLIPGDRALSEEAQQRLQALQEFSHLGSGFRIAMRDLEIRGAGNILGAEQSGNIQQVGYETYKDLIQEAVAEVRGEPLRRRNLPPFELNVDAFIPEEYVPATPQKITLYRRISGVQTAEEVDELYAELKDRFGPIPGPVKRLLEVMRARALAAPFGITRMAGTQKAVALDFESSQYLSRNTQAVLGQIFGKALSFAWKDTPSITYTFEDKADPVKETIHLLKALGEV